MALQPLGITAVAQNVSGFMRSMDQMSGGIQGVGRRSNELVNQMSNLGTKVVKFGLAAGAAAAAGVAALGAGLAKLAIDAAPLEGIQKGFEGLTASFEGGSTAMLAALKESSAGMVTNIDLMKSFNLAAQLISTDFAERMPDAMQYLGKVAAATGQDMGYLMDSLVRGVGRLSPMILDNLAIQVDLTAAYEAFAEENGILVDEMTKTEQQTAVMNQVMIQLAKNTADMPDVVGTAAQQWAAFKVSIKDTKNEIGLALLPVLSNLLSRFQPLIQQFLPKLIELFKEKIVPAIEKVVGFFINLIEVLADAGIRSIEFKEAITGMFPENFQKSVLGAIETIERWIGLIRTFVTEHKDEIVGAIQAIATALAVAKIISILSKLKLILLAINWPLVLLIGAIAAVGAAWKGNWLGIRDAILGFWEKTGRPIFEQIRSWLAEKITAAIEKLKMFWEGTLLPALKLVWLWIQENVFPIIRSLIAWLQEKIPVAIQTLKTFWSETLLPAIQNVWTWVKENVFPIIEKLIAWLAENIPVAIETLRTFWEETLLPAIQNVWNWIKENVFPIIESLIAWLSEKIPIAIETASKFWTETLWPAIESVWAWMKEHLFPFIEALAELIGTILGKAIEAAAGFWEKVLYPALSALWGWVKDKIIPILSDLWAWFKEKIGPAIEGVGRIIDGVTQFFRDLSDTIGNIKLPDWLTPGSMTPLEKGLLGIRDALLSISDVALPEFAKGFQIKASLPAMATQTATQQMMSPVMQRQTTNNFNLNVTTMAPRESLIADYQMLAAMSERG